MVYVRNGLCGMVSGTDLRLGWCGRWPWSDFGYAMCGGDQMSQVSYIRVLAWSGKGVKYCQVHTFVHTWPPYDKYEPSQYLFYIYSIAIEAGGNSPLANSLVKSASIRYINTSVREGCSRT